MNLDNAPLYWPEAREWMWNYCIYLGPYKFKGRCYDLGIYLHPHEKKGSAAVVYGNSPGDYMSGDLKEPTDSVIHKEVIKRAKALQLL